MQEKIRKIDRMIGLRVKQCRYLKSVTQDQLAKGANVRTELVNDCETGKGYFTLEELCRISDFLDVDLREFFERSN